MIPKSNNSTLTNKLLGYQATTSLFGRPIGVPFGRVRMAGNVIWTGGWTAKPVTGGKGNKGKGGGQQYDYITNVLIGLGQGPVSGVFNIWRDKDEFNLAQATEAYTIGGSRIYTTQYGGIGKPYWWVLNVGVARRDTVSYSTTDPGSPSSVTVSNKPVLTPMKLVPSSPGAGEYTLTNDSTGYAKYAFSAADSGKTVEVTYSWQLNNFSVQGSPMTHLNLVLFNGNQSQAPWNYLLNNPEFASQALGYSELAYIGSGAFDLGAAGVIPNLNFELQGRCAWGGGIVDCNPADVIRDILTNPLDGVLGWGTANSATDYGSATIFGHCTISSKAMTVTDGSIATLAVGQSVVIGGVAFNFETIADPTHAVLTDYPGDGTNIPWSAVSTQSLTRLTGSSLWLPADSSADGIGAGGQVYKYCASNGIFISRFYDQQQPAREILNSLLELANADAFWSEGQLKFGSYGDTTAADNGCVYHPATQPIYDIDDSDMVCGPGEEPLKTTRPDARDVKNEFTVAWTNRSTSYAANTLPPARDAASVAKYGRRPEDTKTFAEINLQKIAVTVQNTLLKRAVYVEGEGDYELTLPPHFCRLDPMDLLTVTELYLDFNQKPLRITSIEEDDNLCLKIKLEAFPWSCSAPTLYPSQGHNPTQAGYYDDPGLVNDPFFVALPPETEQGNPYVLGIALSGSENWGGAAVFVSTDDGDSYELVGMTTGPATMGTLTHALAISADPDATAHDLRISLLQSYGELSSYTQDQADANISMIAVESELLAYETADLTGLFQYSLTYLRRGVYGSGIAAHAIGTPFCVLDQSLFRYQFPASQIGKTLKFKFCSVNKAGQRQQDISQVNEYAFTVTAPPPAPTFAVEPSALDPTVAEVTGITFPTDPSNFAIATGSFSFFYVDSAAPDYILSANLAPTDHSVSLGSTPGTLNPGDFAAIGAEIVLCGSHTGGTLNITRGQLGTTAAAAASGATCMKVLVRTVTPVFPPAFFSSPGSDQWALEQALPNMRLVAVTGYLTNAYGNSAVGTVCLTGNADHGLRLDAPAAGATTITTINPPANTDFNIPNGNVVVNVVATTRVCTGHLPTETSDSGNTVTVKWATGNTYDVHIAEASGDTIDHSSSPIVLNASTPIWTGVAE